MQKNVLKNFSGVLQKKIGILEKIGETLTIPKYFRKWCLIYKNPSKKEFQENFHFKYANYIILKKNLEWEISKNSAQSFQNIVYLTYNFFQSKLKSLNLFTIY